MRISATIASAAGLTAAFALLPIREFEWHVVKWAFFLPILFTGAKYGSLAGFLTGMVASVLYGLVAIFQGITDTVWLVALDFALVGLLAGRFLKVWPRLTQLY